MDAERDPKKSKSKKSKSKAGGSEGPIRAGTPVYRLLEALARAIAKDLCRPDRPESLELKESSSRGEENATQV
jgi:hypothetical protein